MLALLTRPGAALAAATLLLSLCCRPAPAYDGGKGSDAVFGTAPAQVAKTYRVQEIASSAPANVFWPGDKVSFTVQVENLTDQPLKVDGQAECIAYDTVCDPLDGWTQYCRKVADCGKVPVAVDLPAKGFANLTIAPTVPARLGAYALVLDLPGHGRQFVAAFLRTLPATPGKVQHPTFALDLREVTPGMCSLWQCLGIKGTRNEWGYSARTDTPVFAQQMERLGKESQMMAQYDITCMLCIEGGEGTTMLGKVRGFLNDQDEGKFTYPGDFAWSPALDEDFEKWCAAIAGTYGWPKGPVNAMELWNEPWEGSSISGWGADMPRYRAMYEHMAKGIVTARAQQQVQVLIGGTCSSMNTEDKLFGDGSDKFLPWLDFTSLHYQPMNSLPALIPAWQQRAGPYGPVRVWDTESWIANSADRVAPVLASMRAQGLSRTAGVLHDGIRDVQRPRVQTADGKGETVEVVQAWPCGAGIAACQAMLGERAFQQVLLPQGLPWLFVFGGLPGAAGQPNVEDGTVVVVGDLGPAYYNRDLQQYRTVVGLANAPKLADAQAKLAAAAKLPKAEFDKQRGALEHAVAEAAALTGATLTLPDAGNHFRLYDFLGNVIAPERGQLVVPLNAQGFYLRGDGQPGSFAALLAALKSARIDGYQPVELVAHDFTSRVAQHPALTVTVSNILNRPVAGTLAVTCGALTLDRPTQPVTLAPYERKTLTLAVTGGTAAEDNQYPLSARFDAGADGTAALAETLHANIIVRRAIKVDGKLDDWTDALPQIITSMGESGPNLTEKAWLPFAQFPDKTGSGYAIGYLAYDDTNFYFAAKIADATPAGGDVRYATRDDDQYYYPEKSYDLKDKEHLKPVVWPAEVPRFSYRKNPDLPFGGDGVQLAFNVLPEAQKGLLPAAPGTTPHFQVYKDTDYEYYLHQVKAAAGGGTEVWRLLAPGVPRKHFYPRQGKAPVDGGPVTGAQLSIATTDGHTRIVECAIPWTELPDVKAALAAGRTIKFSFRATDDKGPSLELPAQRSVAKQNSLAYHPYWESHWANELEFGWEK